MIYIAEGFNIVGLLMNLDEGAGEEIMRGRLRRSGAREGLVIGRYTYINGQEVITGRVETFRNGNHAYRLELWFFAKHLACPLRMG